MTVTTIMNFDEIKANIMEDYDEPISDNYVYDVISLYQQEDWDEMMSYLKVLRNIING